MEKEPIQQPEVIETLQAPVNPSIQQLQDDLSNDFKAQLSEAAAILKLNQVYQLGQKYQTYYEAKIAAQALKFQSAEDYRKNYKTDPRLVRNPDDKYKKTFIGWADYLGTENKSKKDRAKEIYQTYEEAKNAAQALKFQSAEDYKKNYKIDPRLHVCPDKKYGTSFVGWADYLGTDNLSSNNKERSKIIYPTYEEARTAARALKFKFVADYKKKYKKDPRLPCSPDRIYGKAFLGWEDFLDIDKFKKVYRTYEEASYFAQALEFESVEDYKKNYTIAARLPADPEKQYGTAFKSWEDFLGIV